MRGVVLIVTGTEDGHIMEFETATATSFRAFVTPADAVVSLGLFTPNTSRPSLRTPLDRREFLRRQRQHASRFKR
jgi:hypothetical protein